MQNPEHHSHSKHDPADPSRQTPAGDNGGKNDASETVEDIKASGKEKVDNYRSGAADTVDSLADSARAAGDELGDDGLEEQFSHQITQLAEGMGKLSSALRDKSGDEMLRDVQRVAREHPALFLVGSVALGLGAARFAGASSKSGKRSHSAKGAKSHDSSTGRTRKNASTDHTAAHPANRDDRTARTYPPSGSADFTTSQNPNRPENQL